MACKNGGKCSCYILSFYYLLTRDNSNTDNSIKVKIIVLPLFSDEM